MRMVLLGPPGAGKGTQARLLSEKLGVTHISAGDILRDAVKSGTDIGKQAKGYMDRGELVPDDIIIKVILERIKQPDAKKGYILDGFPRTEIQARALDAALDIGAAIELVIDFDTSEQVIIQRLTGRRICKQCKAIFHVTNRPPKKDNICDFCGGELYQREDDKEATIRKRLKVYNDAAGSLIAYYRKQSKLERVSGDLSAEELYDLLRKKFEAKGLLNS